MEPEPRLTDISALPSSRKAVEIPHYTTEPRPLQKQYWRHSDRLFIARATTPNGHQRNQLRYLVDITYACGENRIRPHNRIQRPEVRRRHSLPDTPTASQVLTQSGRRSSQRAFAPLEPLDCTYSSQIVPSFLDKDNRGSEATSISR